MKNLDRFNKLSKNEARGELIEICSALPWVEGMVQKRPMASLEDLLKKAEQTWNELALRDKKEALEDDFALWPGMKQAKSKKLLSDLRKKYKEKFNHPVALFHLGLDFEQVQSYLQESLTKKPEEEWKRAETQNQKHIRLRLEKWILTGTVRQET